MKNNKSLKQCLICKNEILVQSDNYPFCSKKCANIDLTKWLTDEYALEIKSD